MTKTKAEIWFDNHVEIILVGADGMDALFGVTNDKPISKKAAIKEEILKGMARTSVHKRG